MLAKRIIPCLDVQSGRVVKGTRFEQLLDSGDPVELAYRYDVEGADELVFLDITASNERRKTAMELASQVAQAIRIPFTIGGGIRTVEDAHVLLRAGADKVAVNTAAVERPELIQELADRFGSQAVVVAIDARKTEGGKEKWKVRTYGNRKGTGLEAIDWAGKAAALGAGEILLTSIDQDGRREGFDIPLTAAVADAVSVPVIASGGAGTMKDFLRVFRETKASGALAAGMFHRREMRIADVKKYLKRSGVDIRE